MRGEGERHYKRAEEGINTRVPFRKGRLVGTLGTVGRWHCSRSSSRSRSCSSVSPLHTRNGRSTRPRRSRRWRRNRRQRAGISADGDDGNRRVAPACGAFTSILRRLTGSAKPRYPRSRRQSSRSRRLEARTRLISRGGCKRTAAPDQSRSCSSRRNRNPSGSKLAATDGILWLQVGPSDGLKLLFGIRDVLTGRPAVMNRSQPFATSIPRH